MKLQAIYKSTNNYIYCSFSITSYHGNMSKIIFQQSLMLIASVQICSNSNIKCTLTVYYHVLQVHWIHYNTPVMTMVGVSTVWKFFPKTWRLLHHGPIFHLMHLTHLLAYNPPKNAATILKILYMTNNTRSFILKHKEMFWYGFSITSHGLRWTNSLFNKV